MGIHLDWVPGEGHHVVGMLVGKAAFNSKAITNGDVLIKVFFKFSGFPFFSKRAYKYFLLLQCFERAKKDFAPATGGPCGRVSSVLLP